MLTNKPYPTPLPKKEPKPKPKIEPIKRAEVRDFKFDTIKKSEVRYGKVSLLDCHSSQCRWIEGDNLRFVCGEPVVKDSSWCSCHYERVFLPSSVAKAMAAEIRKKRELNRWSDRQRF